jgi:lipopolysaccharide biosynthesis protein
MTTKDTTEFFALKHAIDDQVARLGWSKERCIVYIKERYGVRSRLSMTDEQLKHLLKTLSRLRIQPPSDKLNNRLDRRRRKKRI